MSPVRVDNVDPLPIFEADPIPLVGTYAVPSFPVGELPDGIAEMVSATAEATQTDVGMAATTALTTLAAAVGGRAEIEIRPGWREPLNLFTATVAAPGERKSAIQAELTRPLRDAEAFLAEQGAAERQETETLHRVAEQTAEHARRAAARAEYGPERDRLLAEAVAAGMMADSLKVPVVPRLLADDVTGEAAASLIAEQAGRLAVISAEGGIFDMIAGRYSGGIPNMDVWLKGHAGDTLRVDRKGRDPEYVRRPALTVGLMVQPAVLSAIGRNGSFRGRGLLARFLYNLSTSRVGQRSADAAPVPAAVAEKYAAVIRGLAVGFNQWTDPAILAITEPAHRGVITILNTIEPQLAETGQLGGMADWGAKLVGAIARIAGLIHLAEHGDNEHLTPVDLDTIVRAGRIGEYYKQHAIVAFDRMRMDAAMGDAIYLLRLLPRTATESTQSTESRAGSHSVDCVDTVAPYTVSKRDLHAASTRGRFPHADDLDEPIAILVDHGYLAPVDQPQTKGPGRRPSPRWYVHPSVTS